MPNILMISFDDWNDWSSVLGGYAGLVSTPNLERLAATSATFTNAFAAAPVCNPSRSAVLTGISPLSSGINSNDQLLFDSVDPSQTLPAQLQSVGYTTVTSGKVFHELPPGIASQFYDELLVQQGLGDSGESQPENVRYTMTTLKAGVYEGDPTLLNDVENSIAVGDYLRSYVPPTDGSNLFLSVGYSRPHTPWVAPQEFFDLYPLDSIVLPDDLTFDDFADIPAFADFFATKDVFDAVVAAGELKQFIQAYLACISFADYNLGQTLDALADSAIADDTMIVLWSDHGFHPGEKSSIGKFTLWEQAARANLIIHDPNAPATAGERIDEVVSLQDIYTTLLDYAGVPRPAWAEGDSLKTIVQTGADPTLRGFAVTSILGSHSIRTDTWRYTRYEDGSEELYNQAVDPSSFTNLAGTPAARNVLVTLRKELADYIQTTEAVQNLNANKAIRLDALDGERVLIAGNAADTLAGSLEDNVYLVRAPTVTIEERAGGGIDTILARSSFVLPANVENLSFLQVTAPPGTPLLVGNTLANKIAILNGAGIAEGRTGNDTLRGGSEADILRGEAGNDSADAADGNDTLDGGTGNDTLRGAKGDDVFVASSGSDVVSESINNGFDVIDLAAWGGLANTRIEFVASGTGRTTAAVLSQVTGEARITIGAVGGNINVEALRDGVTLRLLVPNAYVATEGAETVLGSTGGDTIMGMGGADRVDGGTGSDVLSGGDGNDTLLGGSGADLLAGGPGADLLTGGDGADRFVFTRADLGSSDRITDFTPGDFIDLTGIDANEATARRDKVKFRTDIDVAPGANETSVDITFADTGETLTITIDGRIALTAQNFLL